MSDPVPYPMPTDPLHVVICHEDGAYHAQCLEVDIGGQGPTVEEAEQALARDYMGQILVARQYNDRPFELFTRAPAEYWQMWVQQTEAGTETHTIRIPGFTIRHKDTSRPNEYIPPRVCTAVLAVSLVA